MTKPPSRSLPMASAPIAGVAMWRHSLGVLTGDLRRSGDGLLRLRVLQSSCGANVARVGMLAALMQSTGLAR